MQRPTSVTVFGILNFVFAVFGVIGLMASFALLALSANSSHTFIKLVHAGPAYAVWLKICVLLGVLSCAALLAAGIGLLGLKPWARVLSIAYGIYAIVFVLVGMLLNLILMVQPPFEQVPQHQELVIAGAVGGPISGTIGAVFWLIYPIVLLVFMSRPKVIAAFRPSVLPTSPQG